MSQISVYLGGPITEFEMSQEQERVVDRRAYAREFLTVEGFVVYDPTYYVDWNGDFDRCAWDFAKDHHLVTNVCDIVMFDLVETKIASIGSIMEMAWAWEAGKMIPVAAEEGNIHRTHFFVQRTASVIVPTLEDALQVVLNTGRVPCV